MSMIQCVFKGERLQDVQEKMEEIGIVGMTIWEVKGHGRQKGHIEHYRGLEVKVNLLPKLMLQIVCHDRDIERIVAGLTEATRTGDIGDGKIFIIPVGDALRIRTGERGRDAI
ncbi:MAG: P-II family nitrogen regulator [Gaiellales bacterium]|nr:MAG: P-II family nitrogen regulator [Gaiellales bacterium]